MRSRQPSYGMFATALEPQYWFGVPRAVRFAGLGMDVDLAAHQSVQRKDDHAAWIGYNRGLGARYSAMEHLVPEQLFSTDTAPAEGISAVKALAFASAAGQRIYTITADTLYTALNQLQLGADTEREIEQAVLAGKVVTTHQYQLDFHGWIGEGYIIEDPATGSGAYRIAGGGNGSALSEDQLSHLSGVIMFAAILYRALKLKDAARYTTVFAFILKIVDIAANCSEEDAYDLIMALTSLTLLMIFASWLLVGAFAFGPIGAIIIFIVMGEISRIIMAWGMSQKDSCR